MKYSLGHTELSDIVKANFSESERRGMELGSFDDSSAWSERLVVTVSVFPEQKGASQARTVK